MTCTFKDLVSKVSLEYWSLSNDLAILKSMIAINDLNIQNYSFKINGKTNELELEIEKKHDFWSDLKVVLLKKYGVHHDKHERISLAGLIDKIRLQEITLNTSLEHFSYMAKQIKKQDFYQNLKHPQILVNNKTGTYLININSEGIKLSGVSGYLKDVHLIYDGINNQMKIISFGPKINTHDLEYLLNIKIKQNLFNKYYQDLLNKEYHELELLTEISDERFKKWEIHKQVKPLVLTRRKD